MWLLFAGGFCQSFGLQGCRGQGLGLLRAEYTLTQTKELFIVWRLQSFKWNRALRVGCGLGFGSLLVWGI